MALFASPQTTLLQRQRAKYETRNPIARLLLKNFLKTFEDLVGVTQARRAFEVGCGEGELLRCMMDLGLSVSGIDIEKPLLDEAERRLGRLEKFEGVRPQDLYSLEKQNSAELIVCCEVLEHLEHPGAALDILASLATPWLIVSVPREPLWRIANVVRGKYVAELGNTPTHIQHWSARGFKALVGQKFNVVEMRKPFPWTILLCRAR